MNFNNYILYLFKNKILEWIEEKPEVFEEFTHKAFINVLKLNGKPAYYQVDNFAGNIRGSFWCHNQASRVCCFSNDIETAKEECQKHYERLVFENCSPDIQATFKSNNL